MIEKVALALVREGRVLMARSRGQSLFYTVGGKIEPGETHAQALCREVDEETNLTLRSSSLVPVGTVVGPAHGRPNQTVMIHVYVGEIEPPDDEEDHPGHVYERLCPGREIEELAWFASSDHERTTPAGVTFLELLTTRGLIR